MSSFYDHPVNVRNIAIVDVVSRLALKAFGPSCAVAALEDDDNPMLMLTLQNAHSGQQVEIYRGHFAECMRWLRYGSNVLDRRCDCAGEEVEDLG